MSGSEYSLLSYGQFEKMTFFPPDPLTEDVELDRENGHHRVWGRMAVEGGIVLLSYAEDIAFISFNASSSTEDIPFISFNASSSTLLLGLNEEIV